MKLQLLDKEFAVCKVPDRSTIDFEAEFLFYAATDEECSVVCEAAAVPANALQVEGGWRAFRICGVLAFSLVGILSRITTLLADQQIGVFAISTYQTDYILVKAEQAERAHRLFAANGYEMC